MARETTDCCGARWAGGYCSGLEEKDKEMKLSKSQALLDGDGKLLKGKWEIDHKHEIRYQIDGSKEYADFKAKIIDVKPAELTVYVTRVQHEQRKGGRIYRLKGQWRLDPQNRITFEVRRNKVASDALTFKGAWNINKNHEVTYTYLEETLKTKRKITRTLTFSGHWDLGDKNRLTYYIQRNDQSYFRVRGAFQTKSILAKKGEIRYQYGIELEKHVKTQTLILFGKWKYSRQLGLKFEIQYKNSKKRAIAFGAEYSFDSRTSLGANLKGRKDEKLGLELILTRGIPQNNGEAFIRYLKSQDESRIESGLKFRW
jgi:hypothetical protein